jgi:hypothetical protein
MKSIAILLHSKAQIACPLPALAAASVGPRRRRWAAWADFGGFFRAEGRPPHSNERGAAWADDLDLGDDVEW